MGYFDDPAKDKTPLILAGGVLGLVLLTWFVCGFFSAREAFVTGQVTMDKKPVAQARVVFLGQEDHNNRAPIMAETNDDGRYQLIGMMGKGIPRGKYKVAVVKLATSEGATLKGEQLAAARAEGELVNTLPKAYEEPGSSPLEVYVSGGSRTIDLELKPN